MQDWLSGSGDEDKVFRIRICRESATVLLAIAAIIIASSCATSNKTEDKVGLQRSDLTQWKRMRLDRAGVVAEVPTGAYRLYESSNGVSLTLHPVYVPSHIIDEPQMMLTVTFDRSTWDAQQEARDGTLKYKTNANDRIYWSWEYAIHSNTAVWVSEPWSIYRRDHMADSNTLWVGRAELLRMKDGDRMPFLDEDDTAVRKILDSFTPDRASELQVKF